YLCDDTIPEMHVCFPIRPGLPGNGRLLCVGTNDPEDLAWQVRFGIPREHLEWCDGQLLLPDPRLTHEPLLLPPAEPHQTHANALAESLKWLAFTGERRIWMLYSPRFDQKGRDGAKLTGVLGFVVAQVMNVRLEKDRLCVVLQPGMLITDTAVTDACRRHLG